MKFRADRCTRGFTYLELIFVVGVIGVAAAISVPALTNALERNQVYTASELIAAQLREARLAAITRNRTFRVRFDCPDGAIRYLRLTGVPSLDDAPDRCANHDALDGMPVYLPPDVRLGDQPPPSLNINARGLIYVQGSAVMPVSIAVTHGSHTRTIVVTATGRITTPSS